MAQPVDPYQTILNNDIFKSRLEAYFTHHQHGQASGLWKENEYPKIDNGYCSPVDGDLRRKISGEPVVTATNDNYKAILKMLQSHHVFKHIVGKTHVRKHKICFISFLINSYPGGVVSADISNVISKINDSHILRDLIIHVLRENSWSNIESFINNHQETDQETDQKTTILFTAEDVVLIDKIDSNPNEVNVGQVLSLFKSSTQRLSSSTDRAQLEIWNKLKNAIITQLLKVQPGQQEEQEEPQHPLYSLCKEGRLVEKNLPQEVNQTYIQTVKDSVKNLLLIIGTDECTLSKDDYYNMVEFQDLPFTELGSYFHIVQVKQNLEILPSGRSGHCFSIHQVVGQLLSQFENITLGEVKISTDYSDFLKNIIIPWIAYYYSTLDSTNAYFEQLNNGLKDYFTRYNLDGNKDFRDIYENKILETGTRLEKQVYIKDALLFLFQGHVEAIKNEKLVLIHSKIGDVLFNLLAYLGYACLSDDITSSASSGFSIADHCMMRTYKLIKTLNKLKIKDSNDTFGLLLKQIDVVVGTGGIPRSLESLMKNASSDCIHGIGIKLLTAYLVIYKSLVKMGRNPKLAPFFVEVPVPLKSAMNGFEYLTCVRTEISKQRISHCAQSFVVDLFNPDSCQTQRITMDATKLYKATTKDVRSPIELVLPDKSKNPTISVSFFDYMENNILKDYLSDPRTAEPLLQNLTKIPYLFQQERKVGFSVYAKFCHHCCRVAGEYIQEEPITATTRERRKSKNKLYETLLNPDTLQKNKPFDFIEVDEIDFNELKGDMRKFLHSFLAYNVSSQKFMLNTGFKVEDITEITYDLLNNIGKAEFKKGSNANSTPTVLNYNQRNITRIYYYMKLLFKVLAPERYFKRVLPAYVDVTSTNRKPIIKYWTLFERYYRAIGQELSFTTNLWKRFSCITVTEQNTTSPLELDQYQGLLNALKKEPTHSLGYKVVSKLRNHHITDLETIYSDVFAWVSKNKDKDIQVVQVGDNNKYTIKTTELLEELRLRIFNIWRCLSAVFYSKWFEASSSSSSLMSISGLENNPKIWFGYFYTLLQFVVEDIYHGGKTLGSYQYNFTEILQDLYFYEDLAKHLRGIQGPDTNKEIKRQLKAVEEYLVSKVPYYTNQIDTVTGFKHPKPLLDDFKDGTITVFDHWAKATAHNYIKDNMVFKLSIFDDNYKDLIAGAPVNIQRYISNADRIYLLETLQMQYIMTGGATKSTKRVKSSPTTIPTKIQLKTKSKSKTSK